MIKSTLLLGLLVLTSPACHRTVHDETTHTAPEPTAASDDSPTAETEPAVEFEPAYPADVSSEELSEADVAQQETHSHGDGEEHSHAEGDPEHGEEEGQDDHQH